MKKPKLSIIIKALNEEKNISRALDSCVAETKGITSEIILADSLSTDKTVSIAKKYPIHIVQLTNPSERCCGVGPQLGYQHAKGTYVYILDGDMTFEKGFLKKAIKELESDKKLAGVAGKVKEMRAVNIIFKKRQQDQKHSIVEKTYVDKLEMGGLYKREAIEEVGYFSNRNLHAYEEADLGYQLVQKGWKLCRLPTPGIRHYGYDTTSFGAFKRRWKTGYVKGSGEFLHSSFGKKHFFRTVWELKIYLSVLTWWLCLLALLVVGLGSTLLKIFLGISIIGLIGFFIKKRNMTQFLFSLTSWHFSTIGLVWGFFAKKKKPTEKIASKVIK